MVKAGSRSMALAYSFTEGCSVRAIFKMLIATEGSDLVTLRAAVYQAVLGFQEDTGHEPIWLVEGNPVDNEGGLILWRSAFSDAELISPLIHT